MAYNKRFTGRRRSPVLLIGGSSSLTMSRRMCEFAADNFKLNGKLPRVAVLPTASGDNPDVIAEVSGYFETLPCEYDTILLVSEKPDPRDVRRRIGAADVIYVPGGSERRIMEVWAEYGADEAVFDAARRGDVLLAGSSAGAMAFSHACPFVTPEGEVKVFSGYGLVPVWYGPHYQMAEYKGFERGLAAQTDPPLGFASGDDSGILCAPDGRFFTFFGSEGNSVWRFVRKDGGWACREFPEGGDPEIT